MSTLWPRTIGLSATSVYVTHNHLLLPAIFLYLYKNWKNTPNRIRTDTDRGLNPVPLPIGLLAHNGYDRPWSCNLRLKRPLLCHLSYIPAGYTYCINAPDETRTRMESKFRQIKSLVPYQLGDGCVHYNFNNRLHNCFRFMIVFSFIIKIFNPKDRIWTCVCRVWTGRTRRYTTHFNTLSHRREMVLTAYQTILLPLRACDKIWTCNHLLTR